MHTTVFLFLMFFFLFLLYGGDDISSAPIIISYCLFFLFYSPAGSLPLRYDSSRGRICIPSILLGRVTATVTGEVTEGERGKER